MSDAIEIEQLTAERDHYRTALAAQTARVKRLRLALGRAMSFLVGQTAEWIRAELQPGDE